MSSCLADWLLFYRAVLKQVLLPDAGQCRDSGDI